MGKSKKFKNVDLSAVVLAKEWRRLVDQETIAEYLGGPTSETLRNWRKKGMPVEGTDARPKYPLPDCIIWYSYYEVRRRKASGGKIGHVSLSDARAWSLATELRDDPGGFVSVPLYHDHPSREGALRRAAQGIAPVSEAEFFNDR